MNIFDLIDNMLDDGHRLLLLGVTGSTAYGLATETSDIDRQGIYIADLRTVLGFDFNWNKSTLQSKEPDMQLHEIKKFLSLAMDGNPTVSELLHLAEHEFIAPEMKSLIENRHRLLSSRTVKDRYLGYAVGQAKRLQTRTDDGMDGFSAKKATEKHGRHCFRLILQAEQLLTTGVLDVDVSAHRDELFAMGELADTNEADFLERFERKKRQIEKLGSVLPTTVDREWVENFLAELRLSTQERMG